MENLVKGNSLEYFKTNRDMKISLVLTSPSYFMETPKRNRKKDEIGIGETKEDYINSLESLIIDINDLLTDNGRLVFVLGRYGDVSIEPLILNLDYKLSKLGFKNNGYKLFGKGNHEAVVVFSKEDNLLEIPNFNKLQIYKKVGFFGEINPEILEWAIKNFSNEGDLVIDPFAGAGSTISKSIQLKRRALGIELNEEFIK